MELTDSEKEEFMALAAATYDPELWDENDYPILRAARADYEREQARECGDLFPLDQQPTMAEDDEEDGSELNCPE